MELAIDKAVASGGVRQASFEKRNRRFGAFRVQADTHTHFSNIHPLGKPLEAASKGTDRSDMHNEAYLHDYKHRFQLR